MIGSKRTAPFCKIMLDIAPDEQYKLLIHLDQVGCSMFYDYWKQDTTNTGSYPDGMVTMINVNNLDGSYLVSLKSMMVSSGSLVTE